MIASGGSKRPIQKVLGMIKKINSLEDSVPGVMGVSELLLKITSLTKIVLNYNLAFLAQSLVLDLPNP